MGDAEEPVGTTVSLGLSDEGQFLRKLLWTRGGLFLGSSIRSLFFENYIDPSKQAMSHGHHRHRMMLARLDLPVIQGSQLRVIETGNVGGQEQGSSGIGRSSLGDMGPDGLEVSTFVDRGIQAHEGDQLLGGFKATDGRQFPQDNSRQRRSKAWDGQKMRSVWGGFHQVFDHRLDGVDVLLEHGGLS